LAAAVPAAGGGSPQPKAVSAVVNSSTDGGAGSSGDGEEAMPAVRTLRMGQQSLLEKSTRVHPSTHMFAVAPRFGADDEMVPAEVPALRQATTPRPTNSKQRGGKGQEEGAGSGDGGGGEGGVAVEAAAAEGDAEQQEEKGEKGGVLPANVYPSVWKALGFVEVTQEAEEAHEAEEAEEAQQEAEIAKPSLSRQSSSSHQQQKKHGLFFVPRPAHECPPTVTMRSTSGGDGDGGSGGGSSSGSSGISSGSSSSGSSSSVSEGLCSWSSIGQEFDIELFVDSNVHIGVQLRPAVTDTRPTKDSKDQMWVPSVTKIGSCAVAARTLAQGALDKNCWMLLRADTGTADTGTADTGTANTGAVVGAVHLVTSFVSASLQDEVCKRYTVVYA
jgi:hypothetical protein